MKLEDKMKKFPTVKGSRCRCGNLWYFKRPDALECTTCGWENWLEEEKKEKE